PRTLSSYGTPEQPSPRTAHRQGISTPTNRKSHLRASAWHESAIPSKTDIPSLCPCNSNFAYSDIRGATLKFTPTSISATFVQEPGYRLSNPGSRFSLPTLSLSVTPQGVDEIVQKLAQSSFYKPQNGMRKSMKSTIRGFPALEFRMHVIQRRILGNLSADLNVGGRNLGSVAQEEIV